jgi:small subunit ribosomal protein S2
MPVVTMKDLLEAGVHFGHQTRRWNPKMRPYIFTERNGIYILDLQRSLKEIERAYNFARAVAARGQKVLFIGTKKQAQDVIQKEAERCGMPYVNQRWLGGMLTNFVTMRSRVNRLEQLEAMVEDGRMAALPKKEQIVLGHEYDKLHRNLNGVRTMTELPGAVFVVDTKREDIAVAEARRLRIPLIGIVDTNADPDEVDYVIPGNDDAIRAIGLMTRVIADAVVEGIQGNPQIVAPERVEPVVLERGAEPSAETPAAETPEAPAKAAETPAESAEAVEAAVPAAEAPAEAADATPDAEPCEDTAADSAEALGETADALGGASEDTTE